MVSRMKSVSMSLSCTSSRIIKGYSAKKSVECTNLCRKIPLVTKTMRLYWEMCDYWPIW